MNSFPQDNSVLIMDNCSIHKSEQLREAVKSHGCELYFLPPYSPDMNPIEESFSSLKAWVQCNQEQFRETSNPIGMLDEACNSFREFNAEEWFRKSGYRII